MNDNKNIHPVDELAGIREQIKTLEVRQDELRAILLKDGADLKGDEHLAAIQVSSRETVDKAALIAELGMAAVRPFLKTTMVRAIRIVAVPS